MQFGYMERLTILYALATMQGYALSYIPNYINDYSEEIREMEMPKKVWLLIISMFISVLGGSFLWPLNSIYINQHLGKTLAIAGLVLTFNSLAGVIGSMLGGYLFDRIGSYKTIVMGLAFSFAASITLAFNHGWEAYVVCLILMGFGSGVLVPCIFALAAMVSPNGETKTFAAIYIAQNAGVAIGSALGGLLASYSFNFIFIGNAIVYSCFAVLVVSTFYKMPNSAFGKPKDPKEMKIATTKSRKLSPSLKALLLLCSAYILCWFGYTQWQATISVQMQSLNIDLKMYSLLWTINGLMIVFGQPFVTTFVPKLVKKIKVQMLIGIGMFVASFGVLLVAGQFRIFLAAMIIITVGEMLVWPAVLNVTNQLAPDNKKGLYQGITNSAAAVGRMIGPFFGGVMVDAYSMNTLFSLIIGLLVVAGLIMSVYDRRLQSQVS